MTTFNLTAAPHGGWTQIQEPRAIYSPDADTTYFAGINGSTGDAEFYSFPNANPASVSGPIVLHAALGADTHGSPAILIRDSDKRLVVVYSAHAGAALYVRISVNPISSDATVSGGFAAETNIDAQVGGGFYTYPVMVQRLAEVSDPIYIWYRDTQGGTTAVLCYTKSTDGGVTWSAQHEVWKVAANLTYWKIATDGQGRIDFVITDHGDSSDPTASIYHFYVDLTNYHQSDGTVMGGSQPFGPPDVTLVYNEATSGRAWMHDVILDGSNNPRFIFGVGTGVGAGGTDTSYRYARWTGSAWVTSVILASGGAGQVSPMLSCLDAVDLTSAYLTRLISGHYELWRYVTADNGANWSASAITSGSSVDNIYPVSVRFHPTGDVAVLWTAGSYTSATSFSLAVLGSDGSIGIPGFWLDFARDGFDTGSGAASVGAKLVRLLPSGGAGSASDEITSDIISIQIDRTVDLQGGSTAGTMTVRTKNTNGKYNPDNTSSPVYGHIDPGTPAWFGCNADGTLSGAGQTVYGRFGGYLRTIAPVPAGGATDAPTVDMVFDDAFARYGQTKARVEFSTTRTVATYRQAILEAIGETRYTLATEADTLAQTGSLGVGPTKRYGSSWRQRFLMSRGFYGATPEYIADVQAVPKPMVSGLATLEELNKIVASRHFIAPADTKEAWYSYTTRNRTYKLGSAADAALDGTQGLADTSGYVHSVDGVVNAMSVEARPFRIAPQASTIWDYSSLPFSIDSGVSKVIVATFPDIAFDAALTIQSTNSLVTGLMTPYGTGAVIQVTAIGADTVTGLSIDGRQVIRLDPAMIEASDTASQAQYGERQGSSIGSDLIASEGAAEGIAKYHIWAEKAPRKTPAVTIYNRHATLLPLDLLDVVTLTVGQLDLSAKRFEIVGLHETWTVAASASVILTAFTFDLHETPNASALALFTIGSSTLGGTDGLAP